MRRVLLPTLLLCSMAFAANDFTGDPNYVALWTFDGTTPFDWGKPRMETAPARSTRIMPYRVATGLSAMESLVTSQSRRL
jgi:hypothetical protein